MAFKFVFLAAVLAIANAGVIVQPGLGHSGALGYAAPLSYAAPLAKVATVDAEYDPHPQYNFAYDIQDGLTGDSKSQHESRDGDVVHGSYSLVDADGFKRTVEYTADDHNGFNAVVHREPLGHAIAAPIAKIAAPIGYAAPVAKIAAPLGYQQSYYH